MSIASEITRLQGVKADILTAIGNKGVTVPAGSALDDCPDLIASIPSGGAPDIIPSGGIYTQGKALDYYGTFSGTGVSVPVTDLENSIIEISFKLKAIGANLMYIGRKDHPGDPIYFKNYGGYLYGANTYGAYVPWGDSPGDIYLPDFIGQQINLKLYPDGTLKWNDIITSGGGWTPPDGYVDFGTAGFMTGCFSLELYYITAKSGTSTNGYFLPCKRTDVNPYHVGLYNVVNNVMYDAVNSVDIIM